MWLYEKKLEYPVKIKNPNPALAKFIISQVGGPDGELAAATRYLQQRYSMPYAQVKGILTDIGTEELAHIEMVSAIIHQLTRCLTPEQIKRSGFDTYFVDHGTGVYPQAAAGVPFSTSVLQVTGDTYADLYEDLAAEQKARKTYDNILRLADDPDVRDPIKFLREREIVHFQRFGDALRITQENTNAKNFYAFYPSFDKACNPPDKLFSPPCTASGEGKTVVNAAESACASTACRDRAPSNARGRCAAPVCGRTNTAQANTCARAAAPACGCMSTAAAANTCDCPATAAADNCQAEPACGCAAAKPAPACGCAAAKPAPACGCAAAKPAPACDCPDTAPAAAPIFQSCEPEPIGFKNCGCAPIAAPYVVPKRSKHSDCGCG